VSIALSLGWAATSFAAGDIQTLSELDTTEASGESLLAAGDGDCDCCCRGAGFWFAGAEATLLQTIVRSGGHITASFSDTTAPGVATIAFRDGNGINRFGYAPRIWIGRQLTENWGIVGRYWDMTTVRSRFPDLNPAIPNVGTNFATFNETDHARLYTGDIELVRRLDALGWKVDAMGGVRRAHVGVNSDFLGFGVFTTGNFINLTLQNGFTFTVQAARVLCSVAGRSAICRYSSCSADALATSKAIPIRLAERTAQWRRRPVHHSSGPRR